MKLLQLTALLGFINAACALSVADINGPAWISGYNGTIVTDITGIVTAKGSSGFYLRDLPEVVKKKKHDGSSSIYVYGSKSAGLVTVGDIVTVGSAKVDEYRTSDTYIYLTELTNPNNVTVVSSGNTVTPIVLGSARGGLEPPHEDFSALDGKDVYGLPNDSGRLSVVNATLRPKKYGLDFWESLSGELVTVDAPVAIGKSNNYGDFWIRGTWKVSGLNARGGLTITTSSNGKKSDANPEGVVVGAPLDKTKNPTMNLGDKVETITGVVQNTFGFYTILPVTAAALKEAAPTDYPPTNLVSSGDCSSLKIAQYNVENMNPKSSHLPTIASQIVEILKSPDLLYLQEIQDNNGATNNGVTSANETLSALISAIASYGGPSYLFADIDPVDLTDGGAPGGNIRTSYLFNPAVLTLRPGAPVGDALTPVSVIKNATSKGPELTVNPGRIDPTNPAWTASRKPLVAAFDVKGASKPLFAINVHFASKGGSSSITGDARPPINGGIEDRIAQANVYKTFVDSITAVDKDAYIISAGDFNEFMGVEPIDIVLSAGSGGQKEADDIVDIKDVERYSYNYDMNCQQLDHLVVSKGIWKRGKSGKNAGLKAYEHVHVNTWAGRKQVSDHDPAVGLVGVC